MVRWDPPEINDSISEEHIAEILRLAAEGRYRKDQQANDWIGKVVAEVMGLNLSDKGQKRDAIRLVSALIDDGHLQVVVEKTKVGKDAKFVRPSRGNEDPPPATSGQGQP